MTRDDAISLVMSNIADLEAEGIGDALEVLRGPDPEVVNWQGKYNRLKEDYVRRFTDRPATDTVKIEPEGDVETVPVYTVDQMNYYGGTE